MIYDQIPMMRKEDQRTTTIANVRVLLRKEAAPMKQDITILKEDVIILRKDVSVLNTDVSVLKDDVEILKVDLSKLKTDVSLLKDDLRNFKKETALNFVGLAERITVETGKLREEMKEMKEEIFEEMDRRTEDTKRHFEVVAEQLVHDVRGMQRDEDSHLRAKVSDHEKRLVRLERAR